MKNREVQIHTFVATKLPYIGYISNDALNFRILTMCPKIKMHETKIEYTRSKMFNR